MNNHESNAITSSAPHNMNNQVSTTVTNSVPQSMNNQVSTAISSTPKIVVTEPSPVSNNTQAAVSVIRKIDSIPEIVSNGTPESTKVSMEEASTNAAATSAPSTSGGSGEFSPAQECNDCIVPVPEQSSQSTEDAITASVETEPEQDHFRTVGGCSNCGIQCIEYYGKLWKLIHSGYSIPFWLLLLALPVSAGIMSALYMYRCPASHSLSTLMFLTGVCLMAVLSVRICIIIRRMTSSEEESRRFLHTLVAIASFLTVVFFVTESVAYWSMTATSHPGTPQYCDPHFLTFSFWWNCVMFVVIVPIFIFPA